MLFHLDDTLVRASRKLQISQLSYGICGGTARFGRSIFPVSHCLVIVIVSYIILFRKPARKQTTQLYIVLHAQQDRAMHKLVTGIK